MTQLRSVAQVFIASAMGAVLGGLVGSVGGVAWAILGLASGAAVGYLAYDIKAVSRAIKQAAIEVWPKLTPYLKKKTAKRCAKNTLLYILAATPLLSFPLTHYLISPDDGFGIILSSCLTLSVAAMINTFTWLMWSIATNTLKIFPNEPISLYTYRGMWEFAWRLGNVLATALWIVVLVGLCIYGLIRLLVYLVCSTPRFIVFTIRVLQLIHSDRRLCCMLGAIVGVTFGRFFTASLGITLALDGLVGGLTGVWSYFILGPWLLSIPLPERPPKPASAES
ncbi:MAG: hypothetical protein HW405_383 [Candidatus Berkelbacteria bacterium]|nr:hypothetical protein [Candidatus Berkelbacteria bacterium]